MSDQCTLANIENGVREIETSMFQISLKEKNIKGDKEDNYLIYTMILLWFIIGFSLNSVAFVKYYRVKYAKYVYEGVNLD